MGGFTGRERTDDDWGFKSKTNREPEEGRNAHSDWWEPGTGDWGFSFPWPFSPVAHGGGGKGRLTYRWGEGELVRRSTRGTQSVQSGYKGGIWREEIGRMTALTECSNQLKRRAQVPFDYLAAHQLSTQW